MAQQASLKSQSKAQALAVLRKLNHVAQRRPLQLRSRWWSPLRQVEHLKKKCKLWAPTWQKEMGWAPVAS